MENNTKELFGAWIQAIGTVMSAIGSTPSLRIRSALQKDLNVWGNALQATGNSLSADAQKTINLEAIASEIQAIGNSSVIAGLIIDFEEETAQRYIIMGNWLQALGGAAAVGAELQENNDKASFIFNVNGNLLQSIGNSLQAIAATEELQELTKNGQRSVKPKATNKDNHSLEVTGSWIQAVGSVLVLLGQLNEG